MVIKLQTLIPLLPLLLLCSTATAGHRPATINRRGLTTNYCNPLFGECSDQWPFSPINSGNHFISRPFLRHRSLPSVVVPSPPPVFTNPYFTPRSDGTNPSLSPIVSSPPPPGYTIPPADGGVISAPPFFSLTFSPPAAGANLPPIAGKDQPEVFMSPPQENWPDVFNVPPPPLVSIDSQLLEDAGKQPPVGESAGSETQLPPVAKSPPAA